MKLTQNQIKIREELVIEFKEKIYPKNGHQHNLKVVKQIALRAGLKKPSVSRNESMGYTSINYEIIDPFGIAEEEIRTIFKVCLWLKHRSETNP